MIDRAQVEEALDRWESWGPMSWKHDTAPLAAAARAYVDQEITDEMVKRAEEVLQHWTEVQLEASDDGVPWKGVINYRVPAEIILQAALTRGDTG